MVVRNNATDTVFYRLTNNKKAEDVFVRLNMIDYIGVAKNGQEAWFVRDARLSNKKFCCKSTRQEDIVDALCGWGVIPNTSEYKVVSEHGQYTVFEVKTEKPICAFFQNMMY
jgi:hypothetical protein